MAKLSDCTQRSQEVSVIRPLFKWFCSENGILNIWPYRMVRLSLAVVFIWSGIGKLSEPSTLAVIIDAYGLIPENWNMPAALLLAGLETLVGLALLVDLYGSLATVTGLLILFMTILGYGIWLGLDIDCGCFAPQDPEAKAYHGLRPALNRDFILLIGIGYLYGWRHRRSVRPRSAVEWINNINVRRKHW